MSLLLLTVTLVTTQAGAPPSIFTVEELAQYRLSAPVFERFEHATRRLASAMEADPRLAAAPLFTREISVLGDATVAAAQLERRLTSEPDLREALRSSNLNARDYTRFALALLAARLAHGFVQSGALRAIPAGVATDNVAFVEANQTAIAAVLRLMGIEDR